MNQIIEEQAFEFWNDTSNAKARRLAHWNGVGAFEDLDGWLEIGKNNLILWNQFIKKHSKNHRFSECLEWGPGGGSNIIAFAPLFKKMIGVDISASTLTRCEQNAIQHKINFESILIEIDNLQAARIVRQGSIDVFLCTAVFQHFTKKELVEEVMFFASKWLVCRGGLALVQWRKRRPEPLLIQTDNYNENVVRWTTFLPGEFEKLCEKAGWRILETKGQKREYRYSFLENVGI